MFREADEDESGFMCCAFSARERFLMLGTCTGQLKLYNVFTGQEEASYSCHSSAITHLEPSRVSRENYQYSNNFRSCLAVVAECNLPCLLTCKTLNHYIFYFLGWLPAFNVSFLELPSVCTVGHEISVHHEVSDVSTKE